MPTPLRIARPQPGLQRFDCGRRPACLLEAAKADFPAWACPEGCPFYTPQTTEQRQREVESLARFGHALSNVIDRESNDA